MANNESNVIIRPENPSEYEAVNKLIYTAFAEQHGIETGKFMMEHFMEERRRDTFIPALSLVAVLEDDTIVGEVALHETDIATENGNITQLVLSQSAVLPEYRMQGIMRMLVEYALDKAEKLGYGAVFLGGNPNLWFRTIFFIWNLSRKQGKMGRRGVYGVHIKSWCSQWCNRHNLLLWWII